MNDKVDVPECHVLDFRLSREEGDKRRRELLVEMSDGFGGLDVTHQKENHLAEEEE